MTSACIGNGQRPDVSYMMHGLGSLLTPLSLLVAGLFALAIVSCLRLRPWRLKALVLGVALACYLPTTPMVGNWAVGRLEDSARALAVCGPPPPGSLIVVLAGGVRGEPAGPDAYEDLSLSSLRRTLAAVALASHTPHARLLFSGGAGGRWREADLMAELARRLGVPASSIIEDRGSKTTYGSALNVAALIGSEHGPSYLVTSAFHLPRALASFRAVGQVICGWPVDFRVAAVHPSTMLLPRSTALAKTALAFHEWLGMLAYSWFRFS